MNANDGVRRGALSDTLATVAVDSHVNDQCESNNSYDSYNSFRASATVHAINLLLVVVLVSLFEPSRDPARSVYVCV